MSADAAIGPEVLRIVIDSAYRAGRESMRTDARLAINDAINACATTSHGKSQRGMAEQILSRLVNIA